MEEVRAALEAAHLPAKDFAGHSFIIGTATTVASPGLPDSAMQAFGHWKPPLIFFTSEWSHINWQTCHLSCHAVLFSDHLVNS